MRPFRRSTLFVEIAHKHARRDDAERQVDPKDPRPRKMLDDEPAGERAEHRRKRPDAGEVALDAAALVRRIHVADDRHPRRLDGARADALNEPEHDERGQRPGEAAKQRAEKEHPEAPKHHRLAADAVGEFAEHHRRRRLGQQEGGEHPAIELQPAELADDLRHRGRDDRRLDGDHEIRSNYGGERRPASGSCGYHRTFQLELLEFGAATKFELGSAYKWDCPTTFRKEM